LSAHRATFTRTVDASAYQNLKPSDGVDADLQAKSTGSVGYPDVFVYSSFPFHLRDPLENHDPIPKGGMIIAGGSDIEKHSIAIRA
jgi:hypothetical protein